MASIFTSSVNSLKAGVAFFLATSFHFERQSKQKFKKLIAVDDVHRE